MRLDRVVIALASSVVLMLSISGCSHPRHEAQLGDPDVRFLIAASSSPRLEVPDGIVAIVDELTEDYADKILDLSRGNTTGEYCDRLQRIVPRYYFAMRDTIQCGLGRPAVARTAAFCMGFVRTPYYGHLSLSLLVNNILAGPAWQGTGVVRSALFATVELGRAGFTRSYSGGKPSRDEMIRAIGKWFHHSDKQLRIAAMVSIGFAFRHSDDQGVLATLTLRASEEADCDTRRTAMAALRRISASND